MENETLSPEKKVRWLSKVYFGVLDSPVHDVNPFEEIPPFLDATVGQLSWKIGSETVKESKITFCKHLIRVLSLYEFHIPEEEIMSCINNDGMKNRDVVAHFASAGKFQ